MMEEGALNFGLNALLAGPPGTSSWPLWATGCCSGWTLSPVHQGSTWVLMTPTYSKETPEIQVKRQTPLQSPLCGLDPVSIYSSSSGPLREAAFLSRLRYEKMKLSRVLSASRWHPAPSDLIQRFHVAIKKQHVQKRGPCTLAAGSRSLSGAIRGLGTLSPLRGPLLRL